MYAGSATGGNVCFSSGWPAKGMTQLHRRGMVSFWKDLLRVWQGAGVPDRALDVYVVNSPLGDQRCLSESRAATPVYPSSSHTGSVLHLPCGKAGHILNTEGEILVFLPEIHC